MWEEGEDSAARTAGLREEMTTLLDQEELELSPQGGQLEELRAKKEV